MNNNKSYSTARGQRNRVQDELEDLRRRKLATQFQKHFDALIRRLQAEREAAEAALRDLEARKARTREFTTNPDEAALTAWDALYHELQQKKEQIQQRERETLQMYKHYVERGYGPDNTTTPLQQQQQQDNAIPLGESPPDLVFPPLAAYPPTPSNMENGLLDVSNDMVSYRVSELERQPPEQPPLDPGGRWQRPTVSNETTNAVVTPSPHRPRQAKHDLFSENVARENPFEAMAVSTPPPLPTTTTPAAAAAASDRHPNKLTWSLPSKTPAPTPVSSVTTTIVSSQPLPSNNDAQQPPPSKISVRSKHTLVCQFQLKDDDDDDMSGLPTAALCLFGMKPILTKGGSGLKSADLERWADKARQVASLLKDKKKKKLTQKEKTKSKEHQQQQQHVEQEDDDDSADGSVSALWKVPRFAKYVSSLVRGNAREFDVSSTNGFLQGLCVASKHFCLHEDKDNDNDDDEKKKKKRTTPLAILVQLVNSKETILCVQRPTKWFLLLRSNDQYIQLHSFKSLDALAHQLWTMYQDGHQRRRRQDQDEETTTRADTLPHVTRFETHSVILQQHLPPKLKLSDPVLAENAMTTRPAPTLPNKDKSQQPQQQPAQTAVVQVKKDTNSKKARPPRPPSPVVELDENGKPLKRNRKWNGDDGDEPLVMPVQQEEKEEEKPVKKPRAASVSRGKSRSRSKSKDASSSTVRSSTKKKKGGKTRTLSESSRASATKKKKKPPPTVSLSSSMLLVDKQDYLDPITFELMADPVNCDDGNTYDRPVIERIMNDRIQAEEARQKEEEKKRRAKSGQEAGERQESSAATTTAARADCGGARPPIQLTSPLTGAPIQGLLLPNRTLENQIVRLVDIQALDLSDTELQDWKRRRAEKFKRDQERERQRLLELQREEERRRQRELAEKKRSAEDKDPSRLVRIDRNVRIPTQRLCEEDLGLSVAICKTSDRVSTNLFGKDEPIIRCMVPCCAIKLEAYPEWCGRCGRLVCPDCLDFAVTDYYQTNPTNPVRICCECVTQITDVMDPNDPQMRQERDAIRDVVLEKHMALLANRAAQAQDSILRLQTTERYQPRIEDLMADIRALRQSRAQLQDQLQKAGETAQQAEELRGICRALQRELTKFQMHAPPKKPGDLERYHTQLALLESQHEKAVMNLSLVWTKKPPPAAQEQQIHDLERKSESLAARRQTAISRPDFAQDIDQVTAISALDAALEETHFQLAVARSTRNPGEETLEIQVVLVATNKLLTALREYNPASRRGQRTGEPSESTDFRRLLRSLTSRRDRIYRIFNNSNDNDNGVGAARGDDARSLAREMLYKLQEIKSHIQVIFHDEIKAAKEELTVLARNGCAGAEAAAKVAALQREYDVLRSVDANSLSEEEQVAHMIRLSELETLIGRDALAGNSVLQDGADDAAECRGHLAAIGNRRKCPLPLRLSYPTASMDQQLDVLQNSLSLRYVASERSWEQQYRDMEDGLIQERDVLEDEVACEETELMELQGEECNPAKREEVRKYNEERRLNRERRRDWELSQRLESDRSMHKKDQKARAQTQELRRRRQNSSDSLSTMGGHTTQSDAENSNNNKKNNNSSSKSLGGLMKRPGDLRMCKMCRTGPIENQSCPDLQEHNDSTPYYHGQNVGSRKNPNHCPNCGWFHPSWNQWPYWDGVYGPH